MWGYKNTSVATNTIKIASLAANYEKKSVQQPPPQK